MNKLKILELFGGIGACSKALERLKIDYEIADYVEIDKYAVKSFNAIHNTNFEPQDITQWDKNIEVDLIMHGSPCQDFSLAGKQAGGDEGSGTRSSLMYETIRIVEKLKPKYVIWENVKNLLSKKHRHNFDAYLETMSELGYTNYYQVLNAKDYGIPQNRERVFTISILGNEKYEFPKENIQECEVINPLQGISGKSWQFEQNVYSENSILRSLKAGGGSGNIPKVIEHFEFPPKQELKLKLKDMLEDEVDEKYYLSDKMINYCMGVNQKESKFPRKERFLQSLNMTNNKNIATTISTNAGNRPVDNFIIGSTQKHAAISKDGIVPTLTSAMGQGGGHVPMIGENINNITLKSKCKRLENLVKKIDFEQGKVLNMDLYNQTTNENISQCLTEPHHNSQRLFDGLRIRKLTPKECWRLMGFDDDDYEKAAKVNSNTQLYKQAGNSIVVKILETILKELLLNE